MVRYLALVILLTGCAPQIEYRDRVTRVEVPVPVGCLTELPPAVVYPYPPAAGSGAGEAIRAARLGLELHRQVEADLREILAGCIENGP